MTTTAVYAEIVKHERDANGDLLVFGRATSPDLDLDQQVCDPEWLGRAMPEWFKVGNVREQHSHIAAGVATGLEQDGTAWNLSARVVDPSSARKVETGVLKGYSIGIRAPRIVKDAAAPGGRIVDGQIVEVSLVDRPANPTCTLTLTKALKPGPTPTTAVDAGRGLVRVEELHDRTGEPAAALKALGIDVGKGDLADVATAQQAIAIIAALIQSEAEQLALGRGSETCDIDLLLSAVRALEWFQKNETEEADPVAVNLDLAAQTDTEKAAPAAATAPETATPPDATQTPAPDPAKAAGGDEKTDLAELVKAAVAEAIAPIQAQVAKAMEQPAPGGPVLTRTTEDTAKAARHDELLTKAAHYERLADEVGDQAARQGYLQLAADARSRATS